MLRALFSPERSLWLSCMLRVGCISHTDKLCSVGIYPFAEQAKYILYSGKCESHESIKAHRGIELCCDQNVVYAWPPGGPPAHHYTPAVLNERQVFAVSLIAMICSCTMDHQQIESRSGCRRHRCLLQPVFSLTCSPNYLLGIADLTSGSRACTSMQAFLLGKTRSKYEGLTSYI